MPPMPPISAMPPLPSIDIPAAARRLRAGGCVVYPTETFFALGALADCGAALERVAAIKARPATKPLPLLIGEMAQLAGVVERGFLDGPLGEDFLELAGRFWPGPLSLVVPCRARLPALVADGRGMVSVRFTPHPVAAALCRLAGGALVATSANVSGNPPAARAEDLDAAVVAASDGLVAEGPPPGGGLASTVAGLLGAKRLRIFRQGPVTAAALGGAGYQVELP
ncbi:MAG: L-threonylcarbamoyladenylate synthase [Solidesulfovibrio sp.]|uniref:L-threonylcarbamoyladenylate synthase n=1 Tax=Solidesulfovibrio sp. TaxID=2910990 RepID=UPI002B1EB3A3|nr:L-threonylcarbamoyladenylate synthase [Solidesulfovibrio sp.]MEA4858648.1 L-threonylcarbamoyladenylate synthase [Solidesulfovibrio sp.]